jgi:hypothetical protein
MYQKGYARQRSWPNLMYYPFVLTQGSWKTTKSFSQNSRSPGRDLNLGSAKYEEAVVENLLRLI